MDGEPEGTAAATADSNPGRLPVEPQTVSYDEIRRAVIDSFAY